MNPKNTKILSEFKIYNQSSFPDGVRTDDGWFPVLYKLFAEIEKISTDIRVFNIKEKFAELRFSFFCGESVTVKQKEAVTTLVANAKAQCLTMCEKCGEQAEITEQGNWFVCLCPKHLAEHSNKQTN